MPGALTRPPRADVAPSASSMPERCPRRRAVGGSRPAVRVLANLDVGTGIAPDVDLLVERRLLVTGADGRLRITDEGRALHQRAAETQRASRRQVHAGVPNEEYLITLKVLQRMMRNAGGEVSPG